MQDTYNAREEAKLEQLSLGDYKHLTIETKANREEPFEDYRADTMIF
jgi:hypothetical protein